jgi:hypothetical protein
MLRVSRFAKLLAVFILASCDRQGSTGQTSNHRILDANDVGPYERGRRREIELTGAALELLEQARSPQQHAVIESAADAERITTAAAKASGLGPAEYRSMIRRVDSTLIGAGRVWTELPAARIDSLRVALVVLRSRLAAEMTQSFQANSRTRP